MNPRPLFLIALPYSIGIIAWHFTCSIYCMNQGVQSKCITNKATPTRTTPFSKEKGAALGGTRTHDTPLTRQRALPLTRQSDLPTELPGQLSRQGSRSTTQHNTGQSQTQILCAVAQIAQKNPHLICRSRRRPTPNLWCCRWL